MNDDTDKPLNPVGDTALEARITAWVLGEASPFEAAELEEICARDPEARLFERRLRVLHGFIIEDRKAGSDDEWKLPAEKRAKIEALFDEEPVVLQEEDCEPEKVGIRFVRKPVRPRETGRRALIALAACTVISAAGWMLFSSVGESSRDVVALQAEANVSAKRATREEQERSLAELRKAVLVQEDAVEDKRKLLSQIIRSENVVYWGDPSVTQGARGFTKADDAENAAKAYVETEQEKIQLQSQIETLLKYDGQQLMSYASGLSLPDNVIPQLLPQYQEQKRQYEAMKSQGLAANHPKLQASEKAVEGMEKDLNEAVGNLRETLKAKLSLSNEQLGRLKSRMDAKESDAVKQGIANQSFVEAKNDFEKNQRLLEELKMKAASEELRLKLSEDDAALASADQVEFLPGGGGGGSGGGVGMGVSKNAYADIAPASPSVAAMPTPPVAVPAQQSASEMDSLAAVERVRAVDESLFERAGEPAKRSKSSAAGTQKPLGSAGGLELPWTPSVDSATSTAGRAIAANELADRPALGNELALGRDAKPAGLEADAADQFGRNLGGAPVNPTYDLKARFSGEAPTGAANADSAGLMYSDNAAPALATLGQSRDNADFIAGKSILGIPAEPSAEVSDILTAGNRSGLGEISRNSIDAILGPSRSGPGAVNRNSIDASLENTDRPADAAGAADAFADNEAMQLEGGLKDSAKVGELAEAKGDSALAGKAAGSYSGLAQKEMIRRQNVVAASDRLRDEGREAYSKGDYKSAVDKYKASLDLLPSDAPMVDDRRSYLSQVLGDGSTALAEQYRKVGKYEEARQLTNDALALDANNTQAKALQGYLDDPIRTNPALTYQHDQNTEEVRRKLYTAEGNYNLGKFDDAKKTYEDVLRIDPYNKAARRGMEQVAQASSDYYRAAYDQTRAQLLAEVDRPWELPVPPAEQNGLKELEAAAKTAAAPEEVLPRLEKAIREEEVKLQQDPNSTEIQNQIQLLAKVREDLRGKIDAKAKEEKPLEQDKAQAPAALSETLTSAEPFSTFSLHVSDASFKMAKAALDRGEVPAADGIRPEEFYNAFDYGDPAPANGEPVVCAVEQSAHPALPQRNLLRIGVKTGSQGRGGSTPLNLTLLLDSSGSMEREDRNAGLANAVRQLSELLKEGDTVSVIGFARQPRLLVDRLPGNRAQELNAIFERTPSEGGTNLEEGLKLGEELALRQFNAAAQNRIVLFTDGAANLGDAKPETLQAKVEQMRQNGIAFDAAGFGTDGLNDKLLERMTRNGNGRYYIVDRAEDADANFAKQLAGAFRPAAENVKVQVRFNPARVAKYKLIGFEEHRLKKEDFRNDAVDAAEMAAEEAGNALYQIEALPQGEGEVGEVSVRFRDVASGQMVERTWTIPYEAQAPAFDQAAPAIQLAGLAAFAAEKLRGTPMADAVDFQQLAPVMAKVKARYANSKPVADLESMIGKLK